MAIVPVPHFFLNRWPLYHYGTSDGVGSCSVRGMNVMVFGTIPKRQLPEPKDCSYAVLLRSPTVDEMAVRRPEERSVLACVELLRPIRIWPDCVTFEQIGLVQLYSCM